MEPQPLILPPSVRLLLPEEVPAGESYARLRADVARGQAARFTTGYVLRLTEAPELKAYAEVNVHAPVLWSLVRDLTTELLPEHAALLIGPKDEKPNGCPYRDKQALLDAVEPYGEALARDAFVEFGFIWQRSGVTNEVFVHSARWLKIWTTRPQSLEAVMRRHGIPSTESLVFLDQFPRVTDVTHHPPDMYTYDELIGRVLAAEAALPEASAA